MGPSCCPGKHVDQQTESSPGIKTQQIKIKNYHHNKLVLIHVHVSVSDYAWVSIVKRMKT